MKNFNQKLVNWSKKFDFAFKIIFGRFVQKSKFENKPKKIIIFDFHLIGDIVILTPFLINLRKQNPNSYIALVAGPWAKVVLENHPQLYDAFYPVETPWVKGQYSIQSLIKIFQLILFLRSKSWDWGIEVRGDLRQIIMLYFTGAKRRISYDFTGGGWLLTDVVPDQASFHHLLTHHRQIFDYLHPEAQHIDFTPQLWLSPQEQYEVDQTVKCIGLHLGASLPLRMLSKTKAFELLGLLLEKFSETILLFEIPENKEIPNILYDNLSPSQKKRVRLQSFSLREFIVETAKCSLFVGMDSGGGHIAAALGVPVWSIFGPAKFEITKPIGVEVKAIQMADHEVPCRPCDQKKCTNTTFQKCLSQIKFSEMINEK